MKYLIFCFILGSCTLSSPKYYFYYSPSMYQKNGIEGYCKVGDKMFPATHVLEHRLIRKDAVFLGRGDLVEQDSFNRAIWPVYETTFQ